MIVTNYPDQSDNENQRLGPVFDEKPRLGRKKAADPRDRRYLAADHVLAATLRSGRMSRRHKRGPQLDQGQTSRCTVFALAQLVLTGPIMQDLPGADAGPFNRAALNVSKLDTFLWMMYEEAQANDEWPGAEPTYYGTSSRAAAQAFRHAGFWPNFYWLTSVDEIVDYLLYHGPVPVGTDWFDGMDQPDAKGYLRPTGTWRGGHEYLLDGVNVRSDTFYMRQSWGSGPDTYTDAKITFADMDYLLKQGGDALAIPEVRVPKSLL